MPVDLAEHPTPLALGMASHELERMRVREERLTSRKPSTAVVEPALLVPSAGDIFTDWDIDQLAETLLEAVDDE